MSFQLEVDMEKVHRINNDLCPIFNDVFGILLAGDTVYVLREEGDIFQLDRFPNIRLVNPEWEVSVPNGSFHRVSGTLTLTQDNVLRNE